MKIADLLAPPSRPELPGYPGAWSPDRAFRYVLWRVWNLVPKPRYVMFAGLDIGASFAYCELAFRGNGSSGGRVNGWGQWGPQHAFSGRCAAVPTAFGRIEPCGSTRNSVTAIRRAGSSRLNTRPGLRCVIDATIPGTRSTRSTGDAEFGSAHAGKRTSPHSWPIWDRVRRG